MKLQNKLYICLYFQQKIKTMLKQYATLFVWAVVSIFTVFGL